MKIGIMGAAGYVGLVSAACFAEMGHSVVGYDINTSAVAKLKAGEPVIYEARLAEFLERNIKAGRLSFTTQIEDCLHQNDVIFICVGTPSHDNGEVAMNSVYSVCRSINKMANCDKTIVIKSTIPPREYEKCRELLKGHRLAFNPEFLKEGSAISDFMNTDRVVIGVDKKDEKSIRQMIEIYEEHFGGKLFFVNPASASLIKYGSNAMLAVRLALINQIAELCDIYGGNIHEVSAGIGLDSRIGPSFLAAGPGYGGSCLPKDTKALKYIFEKENLYPGLMVGTIIANERHKLWGYEKVKDELKGKKVAVLGLAFKTGTDDTRESPSLALIQRLLIDGVKLKVTDPVATHYTVSLSSLEETLKDADYVFIMTEWPQFRMNPSKFLELTGKRSVIIDCRNLLHKEDYIKAGFRIYGIGNNE